MKHFNCRFRFESNHLLDMSAEEDNELPSVETLLEVLKHTYTLSYDIQGVHMCFLAFFYNNIFICGIAHLFLFPGCLGRGEAEFGGTGQDTLQSPAAPTPAGGLQEEG